MADEFTYDVFLSHSSKDQAVAGALAAQLRKEGLRVWFDEWILVPGVNIPHAIEQGLERSHALLLLMSAHAFGADWAMLETQTFRFRDPLNKERRFIPLRLDDAPIPGSLAQFAYVDWHPRARKKEYAKLLAACPAPPARQPRYVPERSALRGVSLDHAGSIHAYAFTPDRRRVITGAQDGTVRLWDVDTGHCLDVLGAHDGIVRNVALSTDGRRALSVGNDGTLRMWDVRSGENLMTLRGHSSEVWGVAWSPDQQFALSGGNDKTVRVWDLAAGRCIRILRGHTNWIKSVVWSADGRQALSSGWDHTIRVWDLESGRCLRVMQGHTSCVRSVAWSSPHRALSSSDDKTIRLWNTETGRCIRVFEGHTDAVWALALSPNRSLVVSGSNDATLRVWEANTGRYLRVLKGHNHGVVSAAAMPDHHVVSGDRAGDVRVWDLSELVLRHEAAVDDVPEQVQYTNAKVLLVGESGVGKTGLSKRLALDHWQPSDSTVGAWATHWKLPISSDDGIEREIWLWDFGGQADQRLIHQLYMDETALAVLVFDGQKEDLFETLHQWDRDMTRASIRSMPKLLVAGRVDAGGLRVSRRQVEAFCEQRGYLRLIETSAKTRHGCEELKQAIVESIRWNDIPWRTSPVLFKRLKEELVRIKDSSRVLMRFNELREALTLRLAGEGLRFTDDELQAVISLLAGPGVVWELKFGNWILLQPERLNAYAQAVIQTLREDEHERGCVREDRVLRGDLAYHSSMPRLASDDERFVLLAMHQTLVERGLCMREHTDDGALLVFPSYYRRQRPELAEHPAVLVTYRFRGFIDEIYATLVVRLHHTNSFQQDRLWRYAADFKTLTGKQLGVKVSHRLDGNGELAVYFDPSIEMGEKIIFSKYVHEHLLKTADEVERLRHYVCPTCFTPVGNREVAMRRLEEGKPDILCVNCERRLPLMDELEVLFASPEMNRQVRVLEEQSSRKLDIESRQRSLVGEVISTVALAGQISREFPQREHGVDMEIEFTRDDGSPSGRKVYLQLIAAGAGELPAKRRVATVQPVMVVFRNDDSEVYWTSAGDYAGRQSAERFDVMAVRRCRASALAGK